MTRLPARMADGRWSAEEAQAVLELAERSGLSLHGFAAQEGLMAARLYRWRRKLHDGGRMQFVEVSVPTVGQACVEVVLRGDVVVRVPESANVEFVGRLIATLVTLPKSDDNADLSAVSRYWTSFAPSLTSTVQRSLRRYLSVVLLVISIASGVGLPSSSKTAMSS